jgi:hypothetical protein
MQCRAFVTAQQQKAHHTCQLAQTLFPAKIRCRKLARLLSSGKIHHTPSFDSTTTS